MATPLIDAVVNITGGLTRRNPFEEGRNLRNLGLEEKRSAFLAATLSVFWSLALA